jgi:hypothetical protein
MMVLEYVHVYSEYILEYHDIVWQYSSRYNYYS